MALPAEYGMPEFRDIVAPLSITASSQGDESLKHDAKVDDSVDDSVDDDVEDDIDDDVVAWID